MLTSAAAMAHATGALATGAHATGGAAVNIASKKHGRAGRPMGRGDAQNAKFIPLLAAHEHPMLTVDVGLGVEAGKTAGIHPAHPFFGLANVLKSRCITEGCGFLTNHGRTHNKP